MPRDVLIGETAQRLNVSTSYARYLVDTRRIRARRTTGGVRLVDARSLEKFAAEREKARAEREAAVK